MLPMYSAEHPCGADGGDHVAGPQHLRRVVLVFDADVEHEPRAAAHGFDHIDEPAVQRVGVHRHRQRDRRRIAIRFKPHLPEQLFFQQLDLQRMTQQFLSGRGGPARGLAHDQDLPQAIFQLPDALADRRGRDVELARRAIEAAGADDLRKRCQLRCIQP
jgi:hypothetical protein